MRLMLHKALLLAVVCMFFVFGCAPLQESKEDTITPSRVSVTVSTKKEVKKESKTAKTSTVSKAKTSGGVFSFGSTSKPKKQEKPREKPVEKEIDDSGGMKVGMQYFAPWRGHNFNTKSIVRMRGKVKKVRTGQVGMMFIVSVVLETKAKGDIVVDLGPLFYLRTKGMFLTKGNRVEVIGSLIREDKPGGKGREKIVAVEVSKGRRALKFRDLSGTPLWANVQPRMWSPESQGLPGWSVTQGAGKKSGATKNPNKPVVPDFSKPVPKNKGAAGPPSWGSIEDRQNKIRSRVGGGMPSGGVGSGVPTSIGN